MAKKSSPQPQSANLSLQDMEAAIPKIDRRLAELRAINVEEIPQRWDPAIQALENRLASLLVTIFGADTVEYDRYHYEVAQLDRAGISMMGSSPMHEVRDGLKKGINSSIANLESIKQEFIEELGDSGSGVSGGSKTLKAYEGLDLHPSIERAAGQLFRNGHYANAVEDAVKALNNIVRLNSGESLDGVPLMETVFSAKNPILKFNNLEDQSDKDEQKGFMYLFSGAVTGLRNPRAHKIMVDDPETALEFIAFISLLAKLADKASK